MYIFHKEPGIWNNKNRIAKKESERKLNNKIRCYINLHIKRKHLKKDQKSLKIYIKKQCSFFRKMNTDFQYIQDSTPSQTYHFTKLQKTIVRLVLKTS